MSLRLKQVLSGQEDNYLLPFYWQHGNHRERIPEQLERIFASGCRAVCVESRPHPDFCGEGWWADMDIILDVCEKRGAKVWILDDKHFPTGYANGLIETKYPHLRQWSLVERHVDVLGPMADASVLVTPSTPEASLVSAVAYRRSGKGEELTGEPIDLRRCVKGGYLYWDIPEGCYRIFFVYRSHSGMRQNYIDLITPESTDVLLEAVYEPHYARYARYFGNTLAGFFSDEPQFGNGFFGPHTIDRGPSDRRVGDDGVALPVNDTLLEMMTESLGEDAALYLGELWYGSEHAPHTRLAYMDALTKLYRDSFSRRLGDWCRERGVEYIGHVIEDRNAHARLGYGAGHYFRALDGQDMGGVDIVFHQVMPGFAPYMNASPASYSAVDPDFFHYVLAKLGASIAHQNPRMRGRAMCEVFGAYGWGEGTPMMKWLIDFLLVRGINHFVPHAFSPTYPDPDCPPHFGGEGHDPQYDGFGALMRYTNRAAHLLYGGRHIAPVAILYHAEGEWMNPRGTAMLTEAPARALYDEHIDFDIVCGDTLCERATVEENRLHVGDEWFDALVVPYAPLLPAELVVRLNELAAEGLPVLYADALPRGAVGRAIPVRDLPAVVRELGGNDIRVEGDYPLLRVYHVMHPDSHTVMLANESHDRAVDTCLRVPVCMEGDYAALRLAEGVAYRGTVKDGCVPVQLLPGQSEILVFGDMTDLPFKEKPRPLAPQVLTPTYTVDVAYSEDLNAWEHLTVTKELFNVTASDRLPDFSGKMRYTFHLTLESLGERAVLDLGRVGQCARVFVNGEDCGIRIAAPYRYAVGGHLREGDNTVVVEVANTLVGAQRDRFSAFLTLPPSGLLGPVVLEA